MQLRVKWRVCSSGLELVNIRRLFIKQLHAAQTLSACLPCLWLGLSYLLQLRKDNRKITILEQSRLSTEIGATISLQPNATRIIQQSWELKNLLEDSNGTVDHGFRIYNTEGKMVNEVPLRIGVTTE